MSRSERVGDFNALLWLFVWRFLSAGVIFFAFRFTSLHRSSSNLLDVVFHMSLPEAPHLTINRSRTCKQQIGMEKGWKRVCLTIRPSHHFAANRTSIRFRYWLIGASSLSNCCFTWRIFLQQGRSINGNTEECRLLVFPRRMPMPSPALEVVVDQNTFLCPKGPGRIFNKWDLRSDRIKKKH